MRSKHDHRKQNRVPPGDAQTLALAQFVKRVGGTEMHANATDNDEAHLMRDALGEVVKALRELGYAPR